MSYNIIKTMKEPLTGKKTCVLLLDGLSCVLEINGLDKALHMAEVFNKNSDSGHSYEVRGGGKIHKSKKNK